jgi:hypothetical protein
MAYTDEQIKSKLKETVAQWLIPANRFMQELQRVHPEDWDVAIDLSYMVGGPDNEMEVQQYWIVCNDQLLLLMRQCSCEFSHFEEVHIWCDPSSERFGSLAMHELGTLLLDGTYDRHFIRRVMADGKTDIEHYLGK